MKKTCHICPHSCELSPNQIGRCKARKNINDKIVPIFYGKPCAIHLDPIEKKPLYHFFPAEKTLSVGLPGCNLKCHNCQNWSISQQIPNQISLQEISPVELITYTKDYQSKIISYTYTEPLVCYEYILDCSKLAKSEGLYNVVVTAGHINQEPLMDILPYIDAFNIDLKAISQNFYKTNCHIDLNPVLEFIKSVYRSKTHFELTNLLIPTLNDTPEMIEELLIWIKNNLDTEIPIHFSRFFPCNKLMDLPPTSPSTLNQAYNISKKLGFNFVYIGNMVTEHENTNCPQCGKCLVKRDRYFIQEINIKNNYCPSCKTLIAGVWS